MMETFATDPGAPMACAEPAERAIDLVHLARMTFGEQALEREVLDLFVRQAGTLLEAMNGAGPAAIAPLAHRLKGSARGIGAWRVAAAADAVEQAASARPDALPRAVAALAGCVQEAKAVVEELLRSH
jgi:HPt (histidine-containing phosphotransfer) domain-containing protein